jgi:hypothetical protein
MDKTRLVCLFAGALFIGFVFFPPVANAGINTSPSALNFGSVAVSTTGSATVMVTNNGRQSTTIQSVASSLPQFVVSGPTLPATLGGRTSVIFHVMFTPTSAATFTGSITFSAGKNSGQSSSLSVSGTGIVSSTSPQSSYLLTPSVASLAFGNQLVGTGSSQAVSITNTGTSSVTVSSVTCSGTGFSVSGFSGSVTLAPAQSLSLSVGFAPAAAGSVSGSISIVSTATNSPPTIALSGTGVQPLISVSPSSVSFDNVITGATSSKTITVQNPGSATLNVSQVTVSGTGYTLSGPALPLSIAPGGASSFSVAFAPASAGTFSGSLALLSNASTSPTTVVLSGTGVAATLQLSASPSSLGFGSLSTGSSANQSVSVTNTGNSSVTISQITETGAGYTLKGATFPLALSPGQSTSFSVSFTPSATGTFAGTVTVTSNATNSPLTIALSGTGVQPQLTVLPSSVSFASVTVGVNSTQTITVQNPGSASLTISQASVSGTGFSLSGLAVPLSIAPGASTSFSAAFAPTSAGSFSGSLTLVSNAPNSPTTVALSGSGVASTLQLSANPPSLSFGSLTTGTSATQTVTLTNTGNAGVTISQITASGTGFSLSSIGLPVSLAAGQTTSFNVAFAPASTGSVTGSITVTSNATNSPLVLGLSGTGSAPVTHTVSLNWTPSSSTYSGFNVYRGSVSGGPYMKIDSSLIPAASYSDSAVYSGQTYFYVATEVDSTGMESGYSSEVSAVIP